MTKIHLFQIQKALIKDVGTLFTMDDNTSEGQLFGLANSDLTLIKPNYEAMIKNGHLRATEMGLQHVGMYRLLHYYFINFITKFQFETKLKRKK